MCIVTQVANAVKATWGFLGSNESAITAIAGIATAVGVLLAAISLKSSERQVEATTVYNIQKDARDLLEKIRNDPEVFDYLRSYNETNSYSSNVVQKAQTDVVLIIQFYSSVYNQHRDGILSDKFWQPFSEEMCDFIRSPVVAKFWTNSVDRGHYNEDFKRFGHVCLGK